MPGLLADLDASFDSGGISVSLTAQLDNLGPIVTTVQSLLDGPPDLTDLSGAIDLLPLPPGLTGLSGLPAAIEALVDGFDPGDLTTLLQPIIEPLLAIGGEGFGLSGVVNTKAAIDLLRKVLTLATDQDFSGANGIPLAGDLWGRQGFAVPPEMTVDDVRALVTQANTELDALGPQFNGQWFVDLLQTLGPMWDEMKAWPTIPVLTDVMEIAGSAVAWNAMDGTQLTAHLDQQLELIGQVISLPRSRVADPLIAQADTASRLPVVLGELRSDALPLLERLRSKVESSGRPTYSEVTELEHYVDDLATCVEALELRNTPLGRLDTLVKNLELHLIQAVRTVEGSVGGDQITTIVANLLDSIPDALDDPLALAVTGITDLDLSVILDPITAVRDAVQGAVDEAQAALVTVETEISDLISPLADGLDSVISGAGLDDLQTELDSLPTTIQTFVDDKITPAVEPIRSAVSAAVTAVSEAADLFDPAALIEPLREAIEEIADLIGTDEVGQVISEVHLALETAVEAIESLDFAGAGDEVVALIGEIEAKLEELGTIPIPEPAVPVIEGAISVVTDFDFTGEVATPLLNGVSEALAVGPITVLDALQDAMDELKSSLDRFNPSGLVRETLDVPFADVLDQLDDFVPSSLLTGMNDLLSDAVAEANVIDPSTLINPLIDVHGQLTAAVEQIRPSNLIEPVNQAIADAIARLFEVTGVDDVFDGIDDVIGVIRDWVDMVAETQGLLNRVGVLFGDPGEIDTALDTLVTSLVDRIDLADMAVLGNRLSGMGDLVASVERRTIAAEVTRALRGCQAAVGPALTGSDAQAVATATMAFPLTELKAAHRVPTRSRLIDAIGRLLDLFERMEGAREPWIELSADIDLRAPTFEADLDAYGRLTIIDGVSLFADCIVPVANAAQIKASVAAAARDGLELPVTAVFGLFAKLAPHISGIATGLGAIIGALHTKLDDLTGSSGIGGVADSLEAAADLLREFDLDPLTNPLDALFLRVETAVAAVDPTPLGAALQAAADALTGLLDLSTLIDPTAIAQLDTAYSAAVEKLGALSPSAVVAATLDPVYEDLLSDILPLLDLPALLSDLLEGARISLTRDITIQLARVEEAFDAMLRAIPIEGLSGSASVSVDVSVGAGVG